MQSDMYLPSWHREIALSCKNIGYRCNQLQMAGVGKSVAIMEESQSLNDIFLGVDVLSLHLTGKY